MKTFLCRFTIISPALRQSLTMYLFLCWTSLCILGWFITHRDLPVSASWTLVLKVCTTRPSYISPFFCIFLNVSLCTCVIQSTTFRHQVYFQTSFWLWTAVEGIFYMWLINHFNVVKIDPCDKLKDLLTQKNTRYTE